MCEQVINRHSIDHEGLMGYCLPHGMISTTCAISVSRNHIKCQLIFMGISIQQRCDMAFIGPIYHNKPNINYLLWFSRSRVTSHLFWPILMVLTIPSWFPLPSSTKTAPPFTLLFSTLQSLPSAPACLQSLQLSAVVDSNGSLACKQLSCHLLIRENIGKRKTFWKTLQVILQIQHKLGKFHAGICAILSYLILNLYSAFSYGHEFILNETCFHISQGLLSWYTKLHS